MTKFPAIKKIRKNLQNETLTYKFAVDLETLNNTYSELAGLLRTRGNEQGINVKEEAFYKINVQMLLSGVSLCFYINVSVARIKDHFPYFINLHAPEKAQSLGESRIAEVLYQHMLVSIYTTAAC